jgi:hypothetical protein
VKDDGTVPTDVPADVIALLACGLLVLVMRWVFKPSRPRTAPPVDASDARELGLLAVIATALPRGEAATNQERLRSAGIQASLSRRMDGTSDLLVFSEDIDRARGVLGR